MNFSISESVSVKKNLIIIVHSNSKIVKARLNSKTAKFKSKNLVILALAKYQSFVFNSKKCFLTF